MKFIICEKFEEYQTLNQAIFEEGLAKGFWKAENTTSYADPNPQPDEDGKYKLLILPEVEGFLALMGKEIVQVEP